MSVVARQLAIRLGLAVALILLWPRRSEDRGEVCPEKRRWVRKWLAQRRATSEALTTLSFR